MASWDPSVSDVTALVRGWEHAIDSADVSPLITQAVAEVTAEVDDFDPARVINPRAAGADQITLGQLAANTAALRAAYQWSTGVMPEEQTEHTRSLYARYVDALARFRSHVQRTMPGRRRRIVGSVRMVG